MTFPAIGWTFLKTGVPLRSRDKSIYNCRVANKVVVDFARDRANLSGQRIDLNGGQNDGGQNDEARNADQVTVGCVADKLRRFDSTSL